METAFDYTERDGKAYFSTDERKWINKIRKLKEEYPNDVEIVFEPENNLGMLCCRVPKDWLKVGAKRKVNMTEEQREKAAERMREIRKNERVL